MTSHHIQRRFLFFRRENFVIFNLNSHRWRQYWLLSSAQADDWQNQMRSTDTFICINFLDEDSRDLSIPDSAEISRPRAPLFHPPVTGNTASYLKFYFLQELRLLGVNKFMALQPKQVIEQCLTKRDEHFSTVCRSQRSVLDDILINHPLCTTHGLFILTCETLFQNCSFWFRKSISDRRVARL